MYRHASVLDKFTGKTLCSPLIQCQFDYACSSWYSTLTSILRKKLQICQNKRVRFVLNKNSRCHIGYKELCEVGWLNVENRVGQLKLNHMHKIVQDRAPLYLKDQFQTMNLSHSYSTRSSQNAFLLPRVDWRGMPTFMFTGIKLWNNLPKDIQSISSRTVFKKQVKKHLANNIQARENSEYVLYWMR